MRRLLAILVISAGYSAGCAMSTGEYPPTDADYADEAEELLCEDGEELPCCSWSELYVGTCDHNRLVGCGWCLELDGSPGMGPWTW